MNNILELKASVFDIMREIEEHEQLIKSLVEIKKRMVSQIIKIENEEKQGASSEALPLKLQKKGDKS